MSGRRRWIRRIMGGARSMGVRSVVLTAIAILAAAAIAAPILGVVGSIFDESRTGWTRLLETTLPRYATNTLLLAALTAAGAAVVGVSTAWLVTMRDFPGRRVFEIALALPLAFPAYVIAYAYTDLLDHPGAVQSALRSVMGWGPRDYWFPEIRSLGGAALMLTLVLYPYVYLLARAAFLRQAAGVMNVARTLGAGPWRTFFRVALPMARPAIVTGVALVVMETAADFGVVSHFSVQTFSVGIYRSWFAAGDRILAAQLSTALLAFVLLLVTLERIQRGRSRIAGARDGWARPSLVRLRKGAALGAFAACALPLLFGFVIPLAMLFWMSVRGGHDLFGPRYIGFALNSLTLASVAALVTVALAVLIAYARRLVDSPITRVTATIASLGYAVPGSVIAVALLIPLGALDNAINRTTQAWFGVSTGLLLTGSIVAIVFAYTVRFMAVALQTVEAALAKVTPSMDHAARALGRTEIGALRDVHAPMISGGLLTAALIVFVDVMKELPATMIMRPFNFDTLAIQAHRLASDERLLQASTPSLAIVAVGLVPVIVLSLRIGRADRR